MARVPLVDAQNHPELSDVISKISGARKGRLINVYKLLLNTPPVAEAWVDFNSTVRLGIELDARTREMVIIRVAALHRTEYIFRAHVPGYAKEAGLTEEEIRAIADGRSSDSFGERDNATLEYVDVMTRDIEVPDAVFDAVSRHYSDRQIVELTVLVGAYNMHSRVVRALKIDPEPTWDLSQACWK